MHTSALRVGIIAPTWFADAVAAWVLLILADVWRMTPFVAILLLAGLQTIEPVSLGVRPHDIELTRPAEGHGLGRVEIVEPLGSTTVIHLRVDRLSDRLVRVVVPSDASIAVDERVGFRINVRHLHLFDERTGVRLSPAG